MISYSDSTPFHISIDCVLMFNFIGAFITSRSVLYSVFSVLITSLDIQHFNKYPGSKLLKEIKNSWSGITQADCETVLVIYVI